MAFAYTHVSAQASPQEIRTTLQTICPSLPGFLQPTCNQFIGSKIDAIVEAFTSAQNAQNLCIKVPL